MQQKTGTARQPVAQRGQGADAYARRQAAMIDAAEEAEILAERERAETGRAAVRFRKELEALVRAAASKGEGTELQLLGSVIRAVPSQGGRYRAAALLVDGMEMSAEDAAMYFVRAAETQGRTVYKPEKQADKEGQLWG